VALVGRHVASGIQRRSRSRKRWATSECVGDGRLAACRVQALVVVAARPRVGRTVAVGLVIKTCVGDGGTGSGTGRTCRGASTEQQGEDVRAVGHAHVDARVVHAAEPDPSGQGAAIRGGAALPRAGFAARHQSVREKVANAGPSGRRHAAKPWRAVARRLACLPNLPQALVLRGVDALVDSDVQASRIAGSSHVGGSAVRTTTPRVDPMTRRRARVRQANETALAVPGPGARLAEPAPRGLVRAATAAASRQGAEHHGETDPQAPHGSHDLHDLAHPARTCSIKRQAQERRNPCE